MNNTQKIKICLISLTSPLHHVIVTPLAVTTLSGYLKKIFGRQIDVTVKCSQFEPIDEIINLIDKERPEIIGVSLQIGSYSQMELLMKNLKDVFCVWEKQPLIVFGNVIATFAAQTLLNIFSNVLVVTGEGEYALEEIVRQVLNGKYDFAAVPNLLYVRAGKIVENKKILFNLNMLELPSSDYMDYIVKSNGHVWIEGSRGCNARCLFCSRFAMRMTNWMPVPVDKVLETISELNTKFGVNHFRFSDDDFLGSGSDCGLTHATEIANGIIKRGLNITFDISAQVKSIFSDKATAEEKAKTKKTLELLQKAGLTQIFLGVESGSCSQLKRFRKPASVNENYEAILTLYSLGIQVVIGFIIIDYLMTIEELEENIRFLEKIGAFELTKKIFISDFLVTLRAQEGSLLPKLLSKNKLLRYKDAQNLVYCADYKDVRIGTIATAIERWKGQDFALIYALKNLASKLSLEKIVTAERNVIEHFLYKFKMLDYGYLVEIIKLVKQNNDIKKLTKLFTSERLRLVKKLQSEISHIVTKDIFILRQEIDRLICSSFK